MEVLTRCALVLLLDVNVHSRFILSTVMKILVSDYQLPNPFQDGGSNRILDVMKVLTTEHDVFFNTEATDRPSELLQILEVSGIKYLETNSQFRQMGESIDIVILSRINNYLRNLAFLQKFCPNAKFIFDTVDLHHVREERERVLLEKPFDIEEHPEITAIKSMSHTWVVSHAEKKYLSNMDLGHKVSVVSHVHEINTKARPNFESSSGLLFIGGFRHRPNWDAIKTFLDKTWPSVCKRIPGIHLNIIGDTDGIDLASLKKENVNFLGQIHNFDTILKSSRIMIAPLRYGAGIKYKVGLAMASGLPVVTTSIGAEGFGFPKNAVALADSSETFVDRIVDLYESKKKWVLQQERGLQAIQKFTRSEMNNSIKQSFQRVCETADFTLRI